MKPAPETVIDRKKMWREFDRDERVKNRRKLAELKTAIRTERISRRTAIVRARQVCREIRESLSKLIKAMRERALEKLRKATRAQKDAAKKRRDEAMAAAKGLDIISRRKAEYEAEHRHQRTMRLIEQNRVKRRRAHPRATYIERRSESDDEVKSNIPAALWPLFERVKRGIAGGPRVSRTERFMRYAEEHADEVHAVLAEGVDDKVEAMARAKYGDESTPREEPFARVKWSMVDTGPTFVLPEEESEIPF